MDEKLSEFREWLAELSEVMGSGVTGRNVLDFVIDEFDERFGA